MDTTLENRFWDDGFSPIVFAFVANVSNKEDISQLILNKSRLISKRFGRSFVILNFSLIEFSHENVSMIKTIIKKLSKPFIKSIALVGFKKENSAINWSTDDQLNTLKNFECFEQALAFTNDQISINMI